MPRDTDPDTASIGELSSQPNTEAEDTSENIEPSVEPSLQELEDASESATSVDFSVGSICAKCGGIKLKRDSDVATPPRRKSDSDLDNLSERKSDSDPATLPCKGNSDSDLNALKGRPVCRCDPELEDTQIQEPYLEKEAGTQKSIDRTETETANLDGACGSSTGKSSEEALYGDSVEHTNSSATSGSSEANLDSEAGASGIRLTTKSKQKSLVVSDDSATEQDTSAKSSEDTSSDSGISDPPPADQTMIVMTCVRPPRPGSVAASGSVPVDNLQESSLQNAAAAEEVIQIEGSENENENGHIAEPRVELHLSRRNGLNVESNDNPDSRDQTPAAVLPSLKAIGAAVLFVFVIFAIFIIFSEWLHHRKNMNSKDLSGNSTTKDQ